MPEPPIPLRPRRALPPPGRVRAGLRAAMRFHLRSPAVAAAIVAAAALGGWLRDRAERSRGATPSQAIVAAVGYAVFAGAAAGFVAIWLRYLARAWRPPPGAGVPRPGESKDSRRW